MYDQNNLFTLFILDEEVFLKLVNLVTRLKISIVLSNTGHQTTVDHYGPVAVWICFKDRRSFVNFYLRDGLKVSHH